MLLNSLPYVKDWLQVHPTPDNRQAYLICGNGYKNKGGKLERRHYSHEYPEYKKYFKSLLNSPDSDVSAEDKKIIKEKMLTKPWRPYVLRYTSLTEKANGPLNEYQLREHADWTPTSQMPRKYLRFRGDESIRALQRANGIMPIGEQESAAAESGTLAPTIICYNCKEPNKAGSRVCSNPNCKMILSFEVQTEMRNEAENTKKQLENIQKQIEELKAHTYESQRQEAMKLDFARNRDLWRIYHWDCDHPPMKGLHKEGEEEVTVMEGDEKEIKEIMEWAKAHKKYQEDLAAWGKEKKEEDNLHA